MEPSEIMGRVKLTAGRVRDFACAEGKAQSFLWDTEAPGLAVRVTAKGAKAYVFQGKLADKTIRITIGDVKTWAIESGGADRTGAREAARSLQALIDQKIDPRQARAEEIAAAQAKREEAAAAMAAAEQAANRQAITLGEAWPIYIDERRAKWSQLTLLDHQKVIQHERVKGEGDKARKLTAGVLASLAPLPLTAITPERVAEWLNEETPKRATQAALAFRLLRAFINWCEGKPEYKGLAAHDACARKVSREHLPKANAKKDALQREQLRLWFAAVRSIPNVTIAAYLQAVLITGARRNEMSGLRWEDVDFQWNSLTIRDKVEGERTIPLTPYLSSLLRDLQRRNQMPPTVRRLKTLKEQGKEWAPSPWVFSSTTSATGRLEEPRIAHQKATGAVGLPPVSLHGLRRSFGTLSEWVEVPTGVVAQIMGHKPSATAEKHYRERPLDLLRMWHTRIEGWILEQAGIAQPEQGERHAPMAVSK